MHVTIFNILHYITCVTVHFAYLKLDVTCDFRLYLIRYSTMYVHLHGF